MNDKIYAKKAKEIIGQLLNTPRVFRRNTESSSEREIVQFYAPRPDTNLVFDIYVHHTFGQHAEDVLISVLETDLKNRKVLAHTCREYQEVIDIIN